MGNFLDVATWVADSGVQASERGDWFTTDDDKTYIVISDGPTTVWDVKPLKTPTGWVSSVNGDSWVVVLDKNDIGLGNVPNTDFTSIISNKVDKVVGMWLSQESYTSSEQSKLSWIEALADVTNATNVSAAGAVMKTWAQTIAGVKTFSSSPIIPEPTTNLQAATKKYVDDSVSNLGIGDMLASVYDPNNIAEDAFDRANHTGTQTASTISNFSTAVSSNGAVTANTEKEPGVSNFWYLNIPQNSKNSNYTLVLGDAWKHIYNDWTTARTRTIPANASVAFPIGTTITFVNDSDKDMTLAITTDTLVWTDDWTTGTRIVKPQGMATIMKVTATRRFISWVNVE